MTFKEWIFSSYPNPGVHGQWGIVHIITLILCAALVVFLTLTLKNKSSKQKRIAMGVIAGIILLFEIARRVINLIKTTDYGFNNILRILLPRPGCAIACWLVILAVIINKKYFYNFASIISLLCGGIFFCYPGAGFNNQFILFENLYSIVTHSLMFSSGILFITLKLTEFRYKKIWKELICIGVLIVYAFLEIYVLKIEGDPFYFMPGNDVQDILGTSYALFLPIYLVFVTIFINLFYLIQDRKTVFCKRKK